MPPGSAPTAAPAPGARLHLAGLPRQWGGIPLYQLPPRRTLEGDWRKANGYRSEDSPRDAGRPLPRGSSTEMQLMEKSAASQQSLPSVLPSTQLQSFPRVKQSV